MSAVVLAMGGRGCAPGVVGDLLFDKSAGGTSLASRKGFVVVARPIWLKEGLVAVGETRFRKGLFEARVDGPRSMETGQPKLRRSEMADQETGQRGQGSEDRQLTNRRRQLGHGNQRR